MTPELSARIEALLESGKVQRPVDDWGWTMHYCVGSHSWGRRSSVNGRVVNINPRHSRALIFEALVRACWEMGWYIVPGSGGGWLIYAGAGDELICWRLDPDPIAAMVAALEAA